MEELSNLIKVWLTAFISLCYCYTIGKVVSKGPPRLVLLLPIVCLFLYLPLKLSSVTFIGFTAFFIAWLANFKLLLFAFGKGPLASDHSPSISLGLFVAVACLPIKIQQHQPPLKKSEEPHYRESRSLSKSYGTDQNKENPSVKTPDKGRVSLLNYAIKALLLALVVKAYDYIDFIHPKVLFFLYCFYIYFFLELILAVMAALARALLGLELEPQFNEPYLSSSLQDFWGKRWNLMVTSILRPSVYEPTLNIFKNSLGRKWASIPAVMATFMVSAIMHELVFYYLGRLMPTWKITGFFVLHGLCLTIEIVLKKAVAGRWRLPRLISGALTVVFVFSTCFWLFIPQLLRFHADVKMFEECAAVSAFLRNIFQSFTH
ncbi:acyl-CoA--sterol O-acyltransferase 1-like [Humulus lupulus]|uniref:acyl-CoA--sterol O-acyltransferase 1-like n=1 Tax=Humulus lupulus TaxID=3486 RepID=UPI002B416AB8|nr:acyl-CoA--sterol O-acyltransferase 1-like [Humulus lupulus]